MEEELRVIWPRPPRAGLLESFPEPPVFSWFRFGKKFFNVDRNVHLLEIVQPLQFVRPSTGETYGLREPEALLEIQDKNSYLKKREKGSLVIGYAEKAADDVVLRAPVETRATFGIEGTALFPIK